MAAMVGTIPPAFATTAIPKSEILKTLANHPPLMELTDLTDEELDDRLERDELSKFHTNLEYLRSLYIDNFSRLREEVDLLVIRSSRLERIGVDPRSQNVAALRTELRQIRESFLFGELTVAVLGPGGVGKSTLLNRFVGRRNIFGAGSTLANFAFVHTSNTRMHSPSGISIPTTKDADLVLVNHELESLKHVTFFDTIASDNTSLSSSTISFSGIDMDDPAILSISVSGTRASSSQAPESSPIALPTPTASGPTSPKSFASTRDPLPLLESEGVDVVIFVVSPSNLSQVPRSLILKSLGAATVPILVVNKMDSVWDVIHSKGGDKALVSGYESWKANANAMVRNQILVPGLQQFYISAVRDSALSDLEDLEATLSHLVKRKKIVKTLTATCRLQGLAASYETIVSSHCEQLQKASGFLSEVTAITDDAKTLTGFEHSLTIAVATAFLDAIEDMGILNDNVFDPLPEGGAQSLHPFIAAIRLELGIDILSVSDPTTTGSSDTHLRTKIIELLRVAVDGSDTHSASAAFRLSQLHRPTTPTSKLDTWLRHLRLAAAKNHLRAQIELGRALEGRDPVDAIRWYLKAAEKDHPLACLELARCYLEGIGTEKSLTSGVQWLRKALGEGRWWPGKATAARELAKCLESGIGVEKDPHEATLWAAEARLAAREGVTTAIDKILQMFSTDRRPRTPYAVASFLDRLWDQLQMHLSHERHRFANATAKAVPTVAATDGPESALFKKIILEEVQSIFNEWTGGYLDEDADEVDDDDDESDEGKSSDSPTPSILDGEASNLATFLESILTASFPGASYLSEASRISSLLFNYRSNSSEPSSPSSLGPVRPNPVFNLFLATVASPTTTSATPRRPTDTAVDMLLSLLETSWATSVSRLVDGLNAVLKPVARALQKEHDVWTRRRDWATALSTECKTRYDDLRQDIVKALLETREAAASPTATPTTAAKTPTKVPSPLTVASEKAKASSPNEKRLSRVKSTLGLAKGGKDAAWMTSPTTEDPVSVKGAGPEEILKMPFVWEGASIIMSSQLLDEVTGSLPSDAWDWGSDSENASIAAAGHGAKVDDLLDKGVISYSTMGPNNSEALSLWRQAQRLAESSGDLIREANALSNLGCAARMQGNFQSSLAHLTNAWQKTSLFVSIAARIIPDSEAIKAIMTALKGDAVVSIEAGASAASRAGTTQPSVVTSASNLAHGRGPSILVWIMRLLINMGHAYLTIGKVNVAGKWYDGNIRLCENLLAARPVTDAPLSTNSSNRPRSVRRTGSTSSSSILKRGPKLSYFHRSTILSQVRALTHRGLCYATSGVMDEAIRCQTQGLALLHRYGSRIGEPETTYRAAIEANLGNIHYSRGRLTSAISHHARAAMLFLQVDDTGAHARELGNLGALWVEVGKTLRNLQWSREAHLAFAQVVDSGDAEVKMNKAYMAPSTGIPVRTNSGRRGRPVAPQEIESQPGKVYRVGIPYSGRGNDLGINLKAGDKVTVVLLMDDKTTVLGQTAGGLQGTFPISCLLHDVEEDAGGSTTNIAPAPPAPGAFGDYMELMDRYLEHLKGVPELNGSVGGDEEGGHCGTPYVEFGLGMLRDVVQLGAETNEVAVNIAVAEVMLNQPYRAIASLLKLVEGPRSGSKSSSSTPRRIPSSLHKYASLALSSSFLILALSNEDETGSSLYNPDGSDRFAGRGTVDSRRLNLLLSGLGVPSSIQELEKITRADVFPILSNVRGSGGDFHIGGVSAPVSGTMDGVATCILGVLEWITGLWIRDLDAEESGGWMDRGAKKVAEAVDKHVIAVKLVDEAGRRGGSRGLDDPNIKGDASVFTIAAGLRYLEAAIGRLNDKQVGRSDSVSSISSSSSLTHSAGASRSQLLVWSWAVNNTRLQVCSKCAPKALRVSVTGDASGALSHTSDVFPCEHLRASAVSPQADSKAPVVISSTTPSISTVSEKKGDGDLVAEAAEEVVAKMIRRVSAGRLWSRGKAGRDAPTTPTTATQPVPANRRSSIRKEPLWKYESKENAKPNTPLGDDDLVEVLKYALKGLEENVMDKEREASGGRRAARTTPSWINMFYEDATAAVKHLNGIRAEEGGKGRLEQVVEDGEEEGDEQLPMYHPSEAVMVSGV